jgi:hypothetical protein
MQAATTTSGLVTRRVPLPAVHDSPFLIRNSSPSNPVLIKKVTVLLFWLTQPQDVVVKEAISKKNHYILWSVSPSGK